jgi:hypothetical protein
MCGLSHHFFPLYFSYTYTVLQSNPVPIPSTSPYDDIIIDRGDPTNAGLPPIERSPPPSPSSTTESYVMTPTPEPVSSENVRIDGNGSG